MGANDSALRQQTRNEQLKVRAVEREIACEKQGIHREKTQIESLLQHAMNQGDDEQAMIYCREIAKKKATLRKKDKQISELASMRNGLSEIAGAHSHMKLYKDMGALAAKHNKKLRLSSFMKDQMKVQRSVQQFRDGQQAVETAMEELAFDDSVDEEADAKLIMQQMKDAYTLKTMTSMPDAPRRQPTRNTDTHTVQSSKTEEEENKQNHE
jgi:hypothetical protein